jgi:hypothetical protein
LHNGTNLETRFAHTMSRSIFCSAKSNGDNGFQWSLEPASSTTQIFWWRAPWVAELAEANAHLLVEYAHAQDLGQDQGGDRSVSKRALGAGCTSRLSRGHLYLPQR